MRFDTSSLLFVWHKYLRAAKSHGKNRRGPPISPLRIGPDRIGNRALVHQFLPGGLKLRASRKLTSPFPRRRADV